MKAGGIMEEPAHKARGENAMQNEPVEVSRNKFENGLLGQI